MVRSWAIPDVQMRTAVSKQRPSTNHCLVTHSCDLRPSAYHPTFPTLPQEGWECCLPQRRTTDNYLSSVGASTCDRSCSFSLFRLSSRQGIRPTSKNIS